MKNRELREVFNSAKNGDQIAMEKMLKMFRPLIYKNSFIDGKFDEDCFQDISIKFISCIKTFELSPIAMEDIHKSFEEIFHEKEWPVDINILKLMYKGGRNKSIDFEL